MNVAIPVFSIHGNHDDISGTGRLSSMDLLSSMGFINYFGKWRDLSEVEISPIIIQKNETKVAIYGLSHIHDVRLARLFRDHKVNIRKPDIDDKEIFNMMVLHQNRANRGRFNYLPEDRLPGFMDFILWGHEHDCRIDEAASGRIKARICQPGSSVATSLSEGEAIEKKIGILDILETKHKLSSVPLKTVRPFIFRSVLIEDFVDELRLNEGEIRKKVEKFYCKNVDEMIEEARKRLSGHPKQPTLPLIRLRIVFTNQDHVLNITQFGQKFEGKVANPESILAFKKNIKRQKQEVFDANKAAIESAYYKKNQQDCVEDVVESYFNELTDDNEKLKIFSLKSLTEVCRLLVDKGDEQGVNTIFEKVYTNAIAFMSEKMCDEESIAEAIEEFQSKKSKEAFDEAVIENSRTRVQPATNVSNVVDGDFDNGGSSSSFKAPVVRGRGRAAASTRGRGGKAVATDQSVGLNVKKGSAKQPVAKNTTSRAASNSIYVLDSDDSD